MTRSNISLVLVILSACTLIMLSFGFRSSFGLFVDDISAPNGWGRETISKALAIQNLSWGIVAVFAGAIADRYGTTKVIVAATIMYSVGIWFTADISSAWLLNSTTGILVGAGIAGTSFGIVLPAMVRAVRPERRQWVLGLGTAAGSMGQFLVVPLVQGIIDISDWQTALYVMSILALLMALLSIPLRPYSGAMGTANQIASQSISQAIKEALGYKSYLWLLAGFFVCGFNLAFITVHMPSFIKDMGLSAQVGAWSIALIGLFNVIGAYCSGIISGRASMRTLLVWIYLGRALLITAFLLSPISLVSVILFSIVMGLLWLATVPPTSGLVALMFGTRYLSLLYGLVFLSHQLGSFSGVWLGGWLFDQYGSYSIVWWLSVALALFAAFAHLPIKERPFERIELV